MEKRGMDMKVWVKIPIIALGIMILGVYRAPVMAVCNSADNQHRDEKIHSCLYTQKDLKRIREKDKDRFKQLNIRKRQCFYCGCEVDAHSEE